jgi:hyaluronan synthase
VLESVLLQTRPFQRVQVVNDGSDKNVEELARVEAWWLAQQYRTSAILEWANVHNAGKRHAQLHTFSGEVEADVFATIDSDTVLDARCVEEGLKPFADSRIASVTSVILAYNNRHWFVRLTDPWLLTFQLVVRGAMSKLGCVLVNSGNFSMYRADVVREAEASYEAERFMGRPVQFSDDSLLTLFAHLKGRTVQQPSSFAFTVLPTNVSHHLRQQMRWMRGSTIRSIWRFRYLPLKGFAYWEHFAAWVNFVLITSAFVVILGLFPVTHAHSVPVMLTFSLLVCYATALRYLTIARSDQSLAWQVCTLVLAPVMLVWTALVLRPLRIYSIFTCYRTGWGTRVTKVEVTI